LLEKYDIEFNSDKLDANGALIGKKEVKETTATNDSNKQLANTNVQTSEPKEQKAALPEVTNPLFEAEMFYTEKYPKIIFEYWNADFLTIPGADTVVNGANDRLHLGDGLAGAIASADDDNQQVQQTCNKIMANRNGKKLDTGSAINTLGPSNFPNIKKIIHAIPPQLPKIPAGKKIDESDKIFFKKAIQSTLREATQEKTFYKLDANNNLIEENFQTKVLVFPPIGTGLFHYPFEVGVKEIVDLTIQYIWLALIKNPEYQLGEIQKIIFCDTYIPPAHKHKTKAEIDEQNQYKNKVWLDTLNAERNKGNDKFRKLTNVPPPVPIRAEAEAEAAPPPVPVRVTAPPVPVRVTEEAPPPVPIRSESAPPPVPIRSAAPVPIRSAAPVRVEAVRETTVPVRAAAAAVPVPPVLLSKNKQLYMFHQQFTDDKNTNISVNTNTVLSNALNYVINNPSKLPYTDKFNSIYINNTQFPEIYRCENNYFYGVISYNLDQLHKYLKQSSNLTFSKENPLKGYDKNPILPLHVREKLPTNPNVIETTRKKTPSFKPSSTLASESFVKNKSPLKKHTVSVTPTISSLSRPLKASSSSSSFHTLKKPKYYEVPTIKMGKPSTNNKKRTVRRQNSYNDDYNYNDDYSSSYYPLSKYNDNGLRQKKPTKWSQHKLLLFDLNKKRFLLLGRHTLAANMYDTLILGGDLTRDDTYPYIFKESRSYAELFLLKDDRRKTKYLITMNDEEHYQDVKDYLARARIRY
jgi:O-acetyl-ADP-ribose deacetylase (regulator of RNase III)